MLRWWCRGEQVGRSSRSRWQHMGGHKFYVVSCVVEGGGSLEVEFLLGKSNFLLPKTSADWIRFSTA